MIDDLRNKDVPLVPLYDALMAVDLEEELPGPMPEKVRQLLAEDAEGFCRAVVRATKKSIRERIAALKR